MTSLELRARMVVEGLMTGMHRSPYQGFSVEFAQHRQYTPGDDTRFLDWKVFGKTDKLYLKQYQKETNLDMVLLVDASGSMGYGSGFAKGPWRKFDHAATLAAAMAHLALRQQDRVGLTVFDSTVRAATRMSNSLGHWRSIVEALSMHSPAVAQEADGKRDGEAAEPQTDFAGLFDRTVAKLSQRSLLILISDLFDDPALLERGLARLHHRRHDVVILQTLDPAELTFPFRDASEFVGLEAEGRLPLDPAALRRAYLDSLNAHLHQVEQIARRFRFDYLRVDTSQPLGPLLSHFLARRAAGISRK